MAKVHLIKICGFAVFLSFLIVLDLLYGQGSTDISLASEYPATSVVEIQPPGLFPYDQSSSFQSVPVSSSSGLPPMSTNTNSAQPPLQISGQAYLAEPQAEPKLLSPELDQPIGVHVVDSPEGKVIVL